ANSARGINGTSFTGLSMTLINNTFTNNGQSALFFNPSGISFTGGGNVALGNGINGIEFGSGIISQKAVWNNTGMPYVLRGEVNLFNNDWTFAPGVVVKSFGGIYLGIQNGTMTVVGTPDQPIIFTSLRDVSVGGDTNNDGSATVP